MLLPPLYSAVSRLTTTVTSGFLFHGSPVIYAPVIGTGGTVYAASGDTLFALRRDGSLKWKFGTLSKITGVPGLGADGTVYVGVAKYFRGNPS